MSRLPDAATAASISDTGVPSSESDVSTAMSAAAATGATSVMYPMKVTRFAHAELAGEAFQCWTVLAVADDGQAEAGVGISEAGDGPDRQVHAFVRDHGKRR